MERGGGQWESQRTSQRRGFLADGGGQGSEAGKTWAPFDLSSPVASGPALLPGLSGPGPVPCGGNGWGVWVGPRGRSAEGRPLSASAWPSRGLRVLYQLTQPLAGELHIERSRVFWGAAAVGGAELSQQDLGGGDLCIS